MFNLNEQRIELNLKRSKEVEKWNAAKEYTLGKGEKMKALDYYIENVHIKVLNIYKELQQNGKPVTARSIVKIFN